MSSKHQEISKTHLRGRSLTGQEKETDFIKANLILRIH
ncbi:hypothetical protein Xsze_02127 [Xenorhabdus szentirmaii DSM 16338]|nr:hypothetical protein Xsze_02127 [Xenorhabdus szentirmaii DSM 16338]